MASSSSVYVFDNHRFMTAFNEELYNSIVKNKKVIAECCIDLDEDEYLEVKEQISLRGWRRLAAPKQEISIDLIHEFYANAILTEEEMEEAGGHTFRSYVRGKVVDFSPENLRDQHPSTSFFPSTFHTAPSPYPPPLYAYFSAPPKHTPSSHKLHPTFNSSHSTLINHHARGQAQIQVWCAIPLPPSTSTMASSSSVSIFDNHRFKTAFNEELYNSIVKNKKVIAE
ncbi:hypothetical protein PIB30_095281 [Stylosanthes scabra]|uniref:Uncharacterized protein n=1 Tax=Stylosanthes scabra TaxID=79078 RepID=A0ABU6ZUB8_9FABA|nr:hypothetical protein [Stylosanthes scabra]